MSKKNEKRSLTKLTKKQDELKRAIQWLESDKVTLRIPRGFVPALNLFLHHVSDALFGDDRPDHGLAKMRSGKEYFKDPMWFLMGLLKRSELKMSSDVRDRACEMFWKWHKAKTENEKEFLERIAAKHELRKTGITRAD